MRTIYLYIITGMLLLVALPTQATPEALFRKLHKTYTLRPDGSQEMRVRKELTLHTHAAMNSLYGETFITYDPQYQELKIHESYTRQKNGTIIRTPDNAFVEVLPANAANAPAYNRLKEMVVVHTGLELGATIYLDYSIISRPGYLPELDVCCTVRELSPIDEFICQIEVPENKTCHYQWLNASAQPIETHEQGMRILTWTLKKVPPRPYSYPSLHGKLGLAQQVASGMAPVLIATTWNKYADALTSLRQQFVPGNPDIVRAKVQELIQNQKENASDIHQAIARYMNRLYRQALCGVTLQAAGYRLRPASEVIRTAYGTQAELANLHAQLLQTAGLKAEVAVCGLSSKEEQVGLAGILSVIVEDENKCVNSLPGNTEACLQDYLNVTDLQGKKLSLSVCSSSETFKDTLTADKVHTQIPAEGWRILTVPTPTEVMTLYGYAANTSIHENILLPQTVNMKRETFVRLPQGFNWIDKTDKTLSNSCGEVSFRYQPGTDGVTVTQMLRITRQLLTPNDYQAFYALMAEWRDGNNRTLVVKKP